LQKSAFHDLATARKARKLHFLTLNPLKSPDSRQKKTPRAARLGWRWVAGPAALLVLALAGRDLRAWADPNALWRIVHGECVPHMEAGLGPGPCERVDLTGGVAEGVAILKDLVGIAQMLAIPTRRISGIEDPQMLSPDAPDVFGQGWRARTFIEAILKRPTPRETISLAINAESSRTQDQLHVHLDCVAIPVAAALVEYAPHLDGVWRPMNVTLNGDRYFARRVDGEDLAGVDPIRLLAEGIEGAKANMGGWSLAVIGATFEGKPGFVLLADRFTLEGGGHAEDIQDHNCAILRSAP